MDLLASILSCRTAGVLGDKMRGPTTDIRNRRLGTFPKVVPPVRRPVT